MNDERDHDSRLLDHSLTAVRILVSAYTRLLCAFILLVVGFGIAGAIGTTSPTGMIVFRAIGALMMLAMLGLTLGGIFVLPRLVNDYIRRLGRMTDSDLHDRFSAYQIRLARLLRMAAIAMTGIFAVIMLFFLLA